MNMYEMYGLKPMTIEDECNAPQTIKGTRTSKIDIIDWCNLMIRDLEAIRDKAKNIPEEDNVNHAAAVLKYRQRVREAMLAVDRISGNGKE